VADPGHSLSFGVNLIPQMNSFFGATIKLAFHGQGGIALL